MQNIFLTDFKILLSFIKRCKLYELQKGLVLAIIHILMIWYNSEIASTNIK